MCKTGRVSSLYSFHDVRRWIAYSQHRNLWTLQHGCISRHLYYALFSRAVDAGTCGKWSKAQEKTPFQMVPPCLPSFLPLKTSNSLIPILGILVPILPLRLFCSKLFPSIFEHVDVYPHFHMLFLKCIRSLLIMSLFHAFTPYYFEEYIVL